MYSCLKSMKGEYNLYSEYYNSLRNTSRKAYDRYKNCSILEEKDTGDLVLSTREIVEIPFHPNDVYHRLQVNEICRLDILADRYYNNPLLWWVIAQANNIYDPMENLKVDTVLRIPNIETLYGNRGILL